MLSTLHITVSFSPQLYINEKVSVRKLANLSAVTAGVSDAGFKSSCGVCGLGLPSAQPLSCVVFAHSFPKHGGGQSRFAVAL